MTSSGFSKIVRLLLVAAMALGGLLAVSVPALAQAAAVNLSLTPATQTVTIPAGQPQSANFTVTIHVAPTGGQDVSGVAAFVNFDATKLQVVLIAAAAGSPMTMPLQNTYDNTNGYADFSAGTVTQPFPTTAFDLAVITFTAIAGSPSTALSFNTVGVARATMASGDVGGNPGMDVTGTLTGAAVTVMVAPTASFTVSPGTTVAAGATVTFTDTSTGPPTSWSWHFGDGSAASTAQNPTHVYTVAGSYTVTLTATNSVGSNTTSPGTVVTVNPGPLASITVAPSNPSVVVAGSQTFTATTYDTYHNQRTGDTIAWSVTGAVAPGTIDPVTGVLTAGHVAGSYPNSIVATSGAITGTASVTLIPAGLDHITVTPGSITVPVTDATTTFTAATYDQYNNQRTGDPITWSIAAGSTAAGAINASTGAFTAGTTAGTYAGAVVATSGAKTGTATVIVTPGALASITVSPPSPSVTVGTTQTFTAATYDQYHNQRTGDPITWSIAAGSSAAGSINATSGVLTAGTVAGTYTGAIVATSGAISGSTSVTLTPGALASITVSPSYPTVGIMNTQTFTAVGYDQYNNARTGDTFAWSIAAGSTNAGIIDPATGVFTATSVLANVGDYVGAIVATSGAITGTASVHVVAGIINGTVTLQGGSRPASARVVGITLKLFTPGTSNTALASGTGALATFPATTVDTGSNTVTFQVVGVAPGTYDITIVSPYTLMNVKKSQAIVPGPNAVSFGSLLEGDCNNSGVINIQDFSILAASYGKASGTAGFNAAADFDGNGIVNIQDFSLLAANYMKTSPRTV